MEQIKAIFITVIVIAIIALPGVFIFVAATRRSKQQRKIWQAADKYLTTE